MGAISAGRIERGHLTSFVACPKVAGGHLCHCRNGTDPSYPIQYDVYTHCAHHNGIIFIYNGSVCYGVATVAVIGPSSCTRARIPFERCPILITDNFTGFLYEYNMVQRNFCY